MRSITLALLAILTASPAFAMSGVIGALVSARPALAADRINGITSVTTSGPTTTGVGSGYLYVGTVSVNASCTETSAENESRVELRVTAPGGSLTTTTLSCDDVSQSTTLTYTVATPGVYSVEVFCSTTNITYASAFANTFSLPVAP